LPVKENNEAYVEKFWEWMRNNSNHLKVFNILGGEPLHQTEFKDCIDFFNEYPNPEITFGVFSNLQQQHSKFKEKIESIEQLVKDKKIKTFILT
jgi:organic radical activating enzyme